MNRIIHRRAHLGMLALVLFLWPVGAYAALVNINTADATLLDTLPGIGPTYAERIIEYRTVNGPFVRKEDIQNVSGIGPSMYADLAPLITVGEPVPLESPASTVPAPPEGEVSTPPTSPPSTLLVEVSGNQKALLEVPVRFFARVTTKSGAVDPSARISWSFGDGSSSEGSTVEKTYRYAGTYLVVATATDGPASAYGERVVVAAPAHVRLLPVSGDGITVANDAPERLDLSGWQISSDIGLFRIPNGTSILPEASVLFPFTITNLPVSPDARLVYPNGIIAARSLPPALPAEAAVQPSVAAQSFNEVQTVDVITSTNADIQTYDEAVDAPAATVEPVAAGAVAAPAPSAEGTAVVAAAPAAGLFRSPWTYGLLGVVALAGVAFIFL